MPAPPSPHAIAAILLALTAVYLFTRERFRLESSALFILIVVLIWFESFSIEYAGRTLRAVDVLAGFGNEALVAIGALMVLTKALERTDAPC